MAFESEITVRNLFYKLDENNNPVPVKDATEWACWVESNQEKKIVGQTHLTSKVWVSTVFLGLDHNWSGTGPPILWETMIFGGPHDDFQMRYPILGLAELGHEYALSIAKKAIWQRLQKRKKVK